MGGEPQPTQRYAFGAECLFSEGGALSVGRGKEAV